MNRTRLWLNLTAAASLLVLLSMARPAAAAGVQIGNEQNHLRLAVLLQGWAVFTDGKAPDGVSLDTDLYLRRLRLLFIGRLADKVNFFVETDNPNFGKQGDFSSRTFIQDAWVELELHSALQIDAGMLLAPFSHHGMEGATSLHTLDYHTNLLRYPRGSNIVWRDFGVMLRGLLLDKLVEYRLAILNGVHGSPPDDQRNPRDWPRVTARLTLNLFDAEGGPGVGGFFYDGVYLQATDSGLISPKKTLSFGFSSDWQKDLNVHSPVFGQPIQRDDYLALAGDLFFDLPLGHERLLALTGQVDFFYYDYGGTETLYHNGKDAAFNPNYTGYGLLSEIGLRYDAYEILACLDWFEATEAEDNKGDLLSLYGGFNWWWRGHATSLKLQMGSSRADGNDWVPAGKIQIQLLF